MVQAAALDSDAEQVLVVIDTTALWKSLELASAGWPQILAWCKSELIEVAVTDVTLQEAKRHYDEREAKGLRAVGQQLTNLDFLPDGLLPPADQLRAHIERRIADYPERLRTLLGECSVTVLPLPNLGHEALVRRDLETRKPFQQNGKGYRDALNWESLLEHLRGLAQPWHVVFVSSNTNDFADESKERLDALLEAELKGTGHHATYIQELNDAVEFLREYVRQRSSGLELIEAQLVHLTELAREEVVEAVDNLSGATVETVSHPDRRSEGAITLDWLLPIDFIDVTIDGISADESSFVLDIYDTKAGDTYLVHASIDVEVELDGFVHKEDYREDLGLTMFNPDWNGQYMNVGVTETVRMNWYLTVVGNSVEDTSFDSAEPIESGNDEDLPGYAGRTLQGTPIQDI